MASNCPRPSRRRNLELQVPLADHARRAAQFEHAIEQRLRESRRPRVRRRAAPRRAAARYPRSCSSPSVSMASLRRPAAITRATSASKARAKRSRCARGRVTARGHRVAAEFLQHARLARRDGIEHVAHVHARHRARRAAQRALVGEREGDHRAPQLFLDAAGDQPDHALMPGRVEQAHARALIAPCAARAANAPRPAPSVCMSASISRRWVLSASSSRGQARGLRRIIGQQAADADRHVGQPAGRIESRRDGKSQIGRDQLAALATRHLEQRD